MDEALELMGYARQHAFRARHPHGARRARRARRAGAGFTLVELMVALVAGAMAISSIYFVSAASSRHFHEQQRVAQSQQGLRTAMAQIRRDFSRAGYLGTPNTALESACPTASVTPFGAMLIQDGETTSVLDEASTNGVQADQVDLFGNYVTGDAYKVYDSGGSALRFGTGSQSFRRSFGDPMSNTLFTNTFRAGRFVHVISDDGKHFFTSIASSATAGPTVTLSSPLPACLDCSGNPCTLAPVSRIQYVVVDMSDAQLSTLDPGSATETTFAGIRGPVLLRREVEVDDTTTVLNERIVAEYVANFDVDIVQDTSTGLPTLAWADDAAAETVTTTNPERVRSAIVNLAVRGATEDPRFAYVARAAGAPLTRYELNTGFVGAARVRSANLEVVLPNLAIRDL